MSVDWLLPDSVAGARNGEDAAEDGLRGEVGVVDKSMDDDVVGALEVLSLGQWSLAVVKLAVEKIKSSMNVSWEPALNVPK